MDALVYLHEKAIEEDCNYLTANQNPYRVCLYLI